MSSIAPGSGEIVQERKNAVELPPVDGALQEVKSRRNRTSQMKGRTEVGEASRVNAAPGCSEIGGEPSKAAKQSFALVVRSNTREAKTADAIEEKLL